MLYPGTPIPNIITAGNYSMGVSSLNGSDFGLAQAGGVTGPRGANWVEFEDLCERRKFSYGSRWLAWKEGNGRRSRLMINCKFALHR
jgi:hypothetical protein